METGYLLQKAHWYFPSNSKQVEHSKTLAGFVFRPGRVFLSSLHFFLDTVYEYILLHVSAHGIQT